MACSATTKPTLPHRGKRGVGKPRETNRSQSGGQTEWTKTHSASPFSILRLPSITIWVRTGQCGSLSWPLCACWSLGRRESSLHMPWMPPPPTCLSGRDSRGTRHGKRMTGPGGSLDVCTRTMARAQGHTTLGLYPSPSTCEWGEWTTQVASPSFSFFICDMEDLLPANYCYKNCRRR